MDCAQDDEDLFNLIIEEEKFEDESENEENSIRIAMMTEGNADDSSVDSDNLYIAEPVTQEKDEADSQKKEKEKKYKCKFCEKTFSTIWKLNAHMPFHTGVRKYVCPECGHDFKSRSNLVRHMDVHSSISVSCKICFQEFKSCIYLERHMKLHGIQKQFSCSVCSKDYYAEEFFLRHMKHHNKNTKNYVPCDSCDKKFPSKRSLRRHKKDAHKVLKPFSCAQCNETFCTVNGLTQHQYRYHSNIRILCMYCSRVCYTEEEIGNHIMMKHKGFPLNIVDGIIFCTICKLIFEDVPSLRQHVGDAHNLKSPTYDCDRCNAKFSNKVARSEHVMEFHDEIGTAIHPDHQKIFFCVICGQFDIKEAHHQAHLATHSKEKPFDCQYCPLKFAEQSRLLHHMSSAHKKN
ncbi:hypothetical protein DMENIID0001_029430 [Sergentomyia squamirostris]